MHQGGEAACIHRAKGGIQQHVSMAESEKGTGDFRDLYPERKIQMMGHRGVTDPGMRWKQGFNRYEADLYTTFIPEENRLDQKRPRGCFFVRKETGICLDEG